MADADDDSLRLPKSSVPVHYDIDLTTNVHTSSRALTGSVKIDIRVVENTDSITLHNSGLTINEVKLFNAAETELAVVSRAESDKSFLIIEGAETPLGLQAGSQYRIEISYRGNLGVGTDGFYRSSYTADGVTRFISFLIKSLS